MSQFMGAEDSSRKKQKRVQETTKKMALLTMGKALVTAVRKLPMTNTLSTRNLLSNKEDVQQVLARDIWAAVEEAVDRQYAALFDSLPPDVQQRIAERARGVKTHGER